jgi:transposase
MNRTIPLIQEDVTTLKRLLSQERDAGRQQRLHALFLLASGQARSRQQAATLLGVHRHTIGTWLSRYAAGGLPALLTIGKPPGTTPHLTAAQTEQVRAALARPEGFASYGAVQAWIAQTFGVRMSYAAVHKLVRYRLGATLKVTRPSHLKKTRLP